MHTSFSDSETLGKFTDDCAAISRQIDARTEELNAAHERIDELEGALLTSTTMLEALLVQLNSWGHESAVNARGRIFDNEELLRKNEVK